MFMKPFSPYYGKGQNAVVAGAGAITGLPASSGQLMLTNVGTQVLFVRATLGTDSTAATVADLPVLPNTQVILSKDGSQNDGATNGWTRLAYYAVGAGSTLYVTPGEGW